VLKTSGIKKPPVLKFLIKIHTTFTSAEKTQESIALFFFFLRFADRASQYIYLSHPLTPHDTFSGRTALLTSKRCILYMYSTHISTEYFQHGIYCPFFSLQNAVCFIILTHLVAVLVTFYIEDLLKLKK